jgi:hypothetical protein
VGGPSGSADQSRQAREPADQVVNDIPYWSSRGITIALVASEPDGSVRIGMPQAATARPALGERYGAVRIHVEQAQIVAIGGQLRRRSRGPIPTPVP